MPTNVLKKHSLRILQDLVKRPLPTSQINAGVVFKLRNEGLAELVSLPSPFPTHRGRNVSHLKVTAKGIAEAAKTS